MGHTDSSRKTDEEGQSGLGQKKGGFSITWGFGLSQGPDQDSLPMSLSLTNLGRLLPNSRL